MGLRPSLPHPRRLPFSQGLARVLHGTFLFAESMVAQMFLVPLPAVFVYVFGLAVPWIELTLGTLIVLGISSRTTLTASMLLMIALMIGVTLKQDWPTAGLQLMYGFVIFAFSFSESAMERVGSCF